MGNVCNQFVKKVIGLLIISLFFTVYSYGQSDHVCQTFNYKQSTPPERVFLLTRLKANLIKQAEQSVDSIQRAQNYLINCRSNDCIEFRNNLIEIMEEQVKVAKITRALSEKKRILSG